MAQVRAARTLALAVAGVLAGISAAPCVHAQDAISYQDALDAAWAGRTGEGLRRLDAYLATHPGDHAAQLDRARFLAWRGDYAAAIEALDALGGDDDAARALRARVLAWAGRRDAALALNTPLYDSQSGDYDAAWTQALALRQGEWPERALPALATVQADKPDTQDTRDLARAVRLPLFSSIELPLSRYHDSDGIAIDSVGLDANLWMGDHWHLLAGGARRRHSADLGSPFVPLDGRDEVDEDRAGLGARFAPDNDVAVELWLGTSRIETANDGHDNATIGRLSLSQYASDAFNYSVTIDRDRIDASPRALTVLRNGITADLRWTPTLRDTIAARLAFGDFDDGNQRDSALATWTHAINRSDHVMFDLGMQGEWQHNSDNTGNGYYSPDRYTRIAPMASAYISFNQDTGLYLSAALGAQRDETFDSWKRAFDLNAELSVGIFEQWELVARAGYSQRLNQLGRYEGTMVGLVLRYRFCGYRAGRCPQP
jgi:hypothetical protein